MFCKMKLNYNLPICVFKFITIYHKLWKEKLCKFFPKKKEQIKTIFIKIIIYLIRNAFESLLLLYFK